MDTEDVLTVSQAAELLGMSRQAIAIAAKNGDIGRRQDAIGTPAGWVYVFTREELLQWRDRPRHPGGRPPKAGAGTLETVSPA